MHLVIKCWHTEKAKETQRPAVKHLTLCKQDANDNSPKLFRWSFPELLVHMLPNNSAWSDMGVWGVQWTNWNSLKMLPNDNTSQREFDEKVLIAYCLWWCFWQKWQNERECIEHTTEPDNMQSGGDWLTAVTVRTIWHQAYRNLRRVQWAPRISSHTRKVNELSITHS